MNILIIDDHQLFIDGLTKVLGNLNQHVDVRSATSTRAAQSLLNEADEPNLILLDLEFPGLDGISFLSHLRSSNIHTPVILLSATDNARQIRTALQRGANGFIHKSYSAKGMLSAIQKVLAGEVYLPFGLQEKIDEMTRVASVSLIDVSSKLKELKISRRQLSVLELLASGSNNTDIANALSVSEHTVKSHVSSLFKALNVSNRVDCALEAIRLELVNR